LEKEIAESQENHARDTEEWKKFQADLQTAVRVANDFMNGKLYIKIKNSFFLNLFFYSVFQILWIH
jgi:hypothetical protein